MTKKHFEAIADILAEHIWSTAADEIARDLARYFKDINENFDRKKFLDRVGV